MVTIKISNEHRKEEFGLLTPLMVLVRKDGKEFTQFNPAEIGMSRGEYAILRDELVRLVAFFPEGLMPNPQPEPPKQVELPKEKVA